MHTVVHVRIQSTCTFEMYVHVVEPKICQTDIPCAYVHACMHIIPWFQPNLCVCRLDMYREEYYACNRKSRTCMSKTQQPCNSHVSNHELFACKGIHTGIKHTRAHAFYDHELCAYQDVHTYIHICIYKHEHFMWACKPEHTSSSILEDGLTRMAETLCRSYFPYLHLHICIYIYVNIYTYTYTCEIS